MSAAEKFLKLLEQRELVPKELLQRLRRQVASSPTPISPQSLAKQLVQAGHLTTSQAQRLVEEVQASVGPEPAKPKAPAKGPAKEPETAESTDAFTSFLEEELGLAPLEEERPKPPSQPAAPAAPGPAKAPAGAKPAGPSPPEKPPGKAAEQPPAKAAKPPEQPPAQAPKPAGPGSKAPPGKAPAKPAAEKAGPAERAAQKKPAAPAGPGAKETAVPSAGKPAEQPPALASLLEEELGALEPTTPGPGDLESLLAGAATETAAPLGPLAPVAAKRGFWSRLFGRAARSTKRRWDSPLILVGSGALVILILVGIVLMLVLRRESGDLLLEAAHKDFDDGAYTQAIFKYNQFLDRFGGHPAASLARVRRGIAQLRQVVEEGRDWTKAFQTAQQVLEEIAGEEAFREAHVHLSSLLPKIAQGLAAEAEKQSNSAPLALAQQALELLDRYVPRSLQNQVEVDEIQGQLGQLARRFNEQAETEKAVSAIQSAIQADRPAEGYRLARSHLRQYPEAAKREGFRQALTALKECFQKQLRRLEPNRPAQTEPPPSPIQQEIVLAATAGQPIAGLEQEVVVISFNGCLYGLEAGAGKLLWRRWTGPVATGRAPEPQPLPVSSEPQSDLIVPGQGRKELWRLERATGRLRWRSVLPGRLAATPVAAQNRLLAISELPEDRSRLEWIDLETGAAVLAVDLPQKVEVAPAVDVRQDRIYLVGEHSYIWVLSFSEGQCLALISLDHAPGTVTAPPLVVADWLLVAENYRLDQAAVKLVQVGQPGPPGQAASPVVFQEEIPGHVDVPPIAADRRLVVLTDRGVIRVYEIQTGGGKTPLARVAQRGPEGPTNLARFGLLVDRELWVAGAGLDRFEVHSAQGRLEFRPLDDPETGDIFLQTPIRLEKALVHVRSRPGMPGLWVAAVQAQTGRRLWQTQLAVPPAGAPIMQTEAPGRLWVINQAGQLFAVDLADGKGQLLVPAPADTFQQSSARNTALASGQPDLASGQPELASGPPEGRFWTLADGNLLFAFSPPTERWFVWDKKTGSAEWKPVAAPDRLANWPTPFGNGLLVPTPAGRIELRDPRTGEEMLLPFQPPLEPGRMPRWDQPVVIPPPSTATPTSLKQPPGQTEAAIPSPSPAPSPEKPEPAPPSPTRSNQPPSDAKEPASGSGQSSPDPSKAAPGQKEPLAGGSEFLVSDGLGRIYRVGIAQTPKPHLKALGWIDLRGRLVSPVAVVGQNAWLVVEPAPGEPAAGASSPSKQIPSSKPSPASEKPKPSEPAPSATSSAQTESKASGEPGTLLTVTWILSPRDVHKTWFFPIPSMEAATFFRLGSSASVASGQPGLLQLAGYRRLVASGEPGKSVSEQPGGAASAEPPSGAVSEQDNSATKPPEPKPADASPKEKSSEAQPSGEKPEEKPVGVGSRLIRLALPSLEPAEAAVLEGRCIWGPMAVGEWMILATDAGQYILADNQGQLLAKLQTEADRPVGAAGCWQGGVLAACRTGRVLWFRQEGKGWRMDTLVHINRPLASGPLIVEERLVLLGHDGTVYALSLPELMREKPSAGAPSASPSPESVPSTPAPSESEKPKSALPPKPNTQNLPSEQN